MSEDLIGRTLAGRFRLTAYLGAGAMASVYRGEQDAEPKEVAIKVMHPELLRDESFAKRFIREAKAAARIEHKHSVRILDHGHDGDLLYLAMELLVGRDLYETLSLARRFPEPRAVRIALQICSALEAAHKRGIVHRDLKPENVFVMRDADNPDADMIKVLDFGIAKIMARGRAFDEGPASHPTSSPPSSEPPNSVLTRMGTIIGTPEYMSPEQSMGLPVDARSDIYSCGVLLFQMITGKQPFTGDTPFEVVLQQANKPPPLPSSMLPTIHAGLERVILRALAKNKEDRPQSAHDLANELEALMPELSGRNRLLPSIPPTVLRSPVPAAPRTPLPASVVTRTPPPTSDPKMLPGVPSAVSIHTGRDEDIPDTVRSPANKNVPHGQAYMEEEDEDDAVHVYAREDIHLVVNVEDSERPPKPAALPAPAPLAPVPQPAPPRTGNRLQRLVRWASDEWEYRDKRWDPGWLVVLLLAVVYVLLLVARASGLF